MYFLALALFGMVYNKAETSSLVVKTWYLGFVWLLYSSNFLDEPVFTKSKKQVSYFL